MTGLVLKLAPKERILINGAVIENGDRRSRLSIVTPNANILRLKDALHPNDVTTPVRRVCYIAQLVLSGEADYDAGCQQLGKGIDQLAEAFGSLPCADALDQARDGIAKGEIYRSLKALRSLIPIEDNLLANEV